MRVCVCVSFLSVFVCVCVCVQHQVLDKSHAKNITDMIYYILIIYI